MQISGSFLSIKDDLASNLKLLDETSIDYLHFDIMDGLFVINKTWSAKELIPYVKDLKHPFDIHLMVKDPFYYAECFAVLKPQFITFHLEATDDVLGLIAKIKANNIKVGIALKPDTTLAAIEEYLDKIDLVLIMSVEPGAGGQSYLTSTTSKLKALKNIRDKNNYHFLIEVDGGINAKTIKEIKDADIAVVGSYITLNPPYQKQVDNLKKKD